MTPAHSMRVSSHDIFLHCMLGQGACPLGIQKVLVKMINRHVLQFEKYNTNNRDLIPQLLT